LRKHKNVGSKPRNEHTYISKHKDIWKTGGNEKSVTKIHLHRIGCLNLALAISCPSKTSISGMRTDFKFRQEFCSVTFQTASAMGQTMHVTTAGVQRASLVPHVIQVTRTLVQRLMIHSQSMWGKSVIAYGFFLFQVQDPKRILRKHCSLKAYCARPIQYSNCSHFCRLTRCENSKQRKVELFVGEKLDR